MDKNQAKQSFANYISFRIQAKEELAEIEKIINLQEQNQKVNASFEKHSRNLLNAQGLLNTHNINGEVNMNDFQDYNSVVNELKKIKNKYENENNKNSANIPKSDYCFGCKKSIITQYFQKDEKKFCSQYCLDEYYVCDNCKQKIKEITGKYHQSDSFSRNRGAKGLICEICYRGACCECHQPNPENYFYHKEKADSRKFCSKNCFINHYEKELSQEKEIQNHEEALAELEKLSKERKGMSNDFSKGLNDYVENQRNKNNNSNDIERERERANSLSATTITLRNYHLRTKSY